MDTKNLLLDTQVCFRVPLACTPCTALYWPADNDEVHHILDTQQCKTIMTLSDHKGKKLLETLFKCISCKIFEQCLFIAGQEVETNFSVKTNNKQKSQIMIVGRIAEMEK
jgi:hypothetical protein